MCIASSLYSDQTPTSTVIEDAGYETDYLKFDFLNIFVQLVILNAFKKTHYQNCTINLLSVDVMLL